MAFFNKIENEQGLTLMETIIYIAVFGFVITALISFALSVSVIRDKNYAAQEVQANGEAVIEFLSDKIKSCEGVISPASGEAGSVLELDMPDTLDNLVFSIASGTVYAASGADSPVAITSSEVYVSSLVYNNLSGLGEKDNIGLELSLRYRNNESQEYSFTQNLRTAVGTRL